MDNGMTARRMLVLLMACFCLTAQAQIYKIVDKDGNVTYTDQAPGDGTEPMVLPELSVISTDTAASDQATTEEAEPADEEPTMRDLRKLYKDFRISQPSPEETFWGTENAVVVAWESKEALREGLGVQFTVDGAARPVSNENMLGLTLDRGAHTVSASIVDQRGRTVASTAPVTFYVQQATAGGRRP